MITVVTAVRDLKDEKKVKANLKHGGIKSAILTAGNNPSVQRNKAVKKAGGRYIYFLDDDSAPVPGNIQKALKIFRKDKSVAVIGGPAITPVTDSFFQKGFGAVLASAFATGASRARYKSSGKTRFTNERELILCNMFIRKDVFKELGGFDPGLYPNEENDFLNRVQKAGYRIVYDPGVIVMRSQRKYYHDFIKQCFRYGKGRAEQMARGFTSKDIFNLVPIFFVIYLAAISFITVPFWVFYPFIAYCALNVLFSLKETAVLKNPLQFLNLLMCFPFLHVSYGLGTAAGALGGLFAGKKGAEIPVKTKVIKI